MTQRDLDLRSAGSRIGYAPLPSLTISAIQQIIELVKYNGVPALGDVDYDGD